MRFLQWRYSPDDEWEDLEEGTPDELTKLRTKYILAFGGQGEFRIVRS